jgi:hypothetical protein
MHYIAVVALVISALWCSAETRLQVLDPSRAPFPDVLVIVRDMTKGVEMGRYLSDKEGRIPPLNLGNEIYQLIVTCPYGICKTTVREIAGARSPAELTVVVPPRPTDELGMLVGAPVAQISVVSKDQPIASATILVRDEQAIRQEWYTTDAHGAANVQLPSDPAVIVIMRERGRLSVLNL